MDLLNPLTNKLAKRLNLTYQEAMEVSQIMQNMIAENKNLTWDMIHQIAEEMKSLRVKKLKGQN